jgi:hypothetical protein
VAEEPPSELERIAIALEDLPQRIVSEHRSQEMTEQMLGQMKQSFERGAAERKAAVAERRANIAIALTALTALASLVAAIAGLAGA